MNEVNDVVEQLKARSHDPALEPHYKLAGLIEEVSDRIHELMEEQGVSKSELAARVGVSRARIGALLSGDQNMTLKTVAKLLDGLDCDLGLEIRPRTKRRSMTQTRRTPAGARATQPRAVRVS